VGGPAKLAEMFNVSKQAASEWGRVRPIPRHARPRLEQLVRQRASEPDENINRGVGDTPWRSLASLIEGTGLQIAPPPDERESVKASSTWQAMTEEHKNDLRSYVRQAALIAAAVQHLLPHDSAHNIIATLSTEVSAHVNHELLRFRQ
jgi:hypothetical protein